MRSPELVKRANANAIPTKTFLAVFAASAALSGCVETDPDPHPAHLPAGTEIYEAEKGDHEAMGVEDGRTVYTINDYQLDAVVDSGCTNDNAEVNYHVDIWFPIGVQVWCELE